MDLANEELLRKLQNIGEYKFEEFIADLWEEQGWNTSVTSGSNDNGVDIIAEKDIPFFQKQLIQAKRYSSDTKVGSPDIQQYSSLKHQIDDVDSVIVVTTGNFTSQAQDVAGNLNVKTIDGNELISIINKLEVDGVVSKHIDMKSGEFAQSDQDPETLSDIKRKAIESDTKRTRKQSVSDIKKKLDECIRMTESGNARSIVYFNNSKAGYSIEPRRWIADSDTFMYNVHRFVDSASNITKFGRNNSKIKLVANMNDLQVMSTKKYDDNIHCVGRMNGGKPDADEIYDVMYDCLSRVFSVPPQVVNIVNDRS
jgi:hypothetical protein